MNKRNNICVYCASSGDLDKEYIENWDIGLDIKILLKTVMVVVKKDGSM
mgnify:CR=1 FL=1